MAADSVPIASVLRHLGPADWQIANETSRDKVLEGFASRPSYLPGETLTLFVSTSAPSFDVGIWRVSGGEPDGSPFRHVANIDSVVGVHQGPPVVDPLTKMVAARWAPTVSFVIPPDLASGVYVARLASRQNVQSYVPFVIRSPSTHAVLVVSSALTWQAYNEWGGSSVYATSVGEPLPGVERALAVSFDRPYLKEAGAGQLLSLELPFLQWIDRQAFDVSYTTDYDLAISPPEGIVPKIVVFNGHSEYWTPRLYAWIERHVETLGDMGVAVLAADTGYWPISFDQPAGAGPRSFVSLKNGPVPRELTPGLEPGASGPLGQPHASPPGSPAPGLGTQAPEVEQTGDVPFTVLGPDGPYLGSFAEQPIFGVRYRGITSALGRYTLTGAGADPRLLEGTGLSAGSSLGFIAGGEVDGVSLDADKQGQVGRRYDHVFAESALISGRNGRPVTAQSVWRELPSGGRVFSAGTFYWGWALDPEWGAVHEVPEGFARLSLNVLRLLGADATR
jgi:hypothetical protein